MLGLYLAEKGTRLSGIFDYPEAAKSHDSWIIGTRLYILKHPKKLGKRKLLTTHPPKEKQGKEDQEQEKNPKERKRT